MPINISIWNETSVYSCRDVDKWLTLILYSYKKKWCKTLLLRFFKHFCFFQNISIITKVVFFFLMSTGTLPKTRCKTAVFKLYQCFPFLFLSLMTVILVLQHYIFVLKYFINSCKSNVNDSHQSLPPCPQHRSNRIRAICSVI